MQSNSISIMGRAQLVIQLQKNNSTVTRIAIPSAKQAETGQTYLVEGMEDQYSTIRLSFGIYFTNYSILPKSNVTFLRLKE